MTFNVWTFLFEIINFVVLAYVLHRLLYKPLREAIDRRREQTAHAQAEAERAREDAERARVALEQKLTEAEQQRQEVVRQARDRAEADSQRLLQGAEQTVARRREEAAVALERERALALAALRDQVVGQALGLARRLLREASGQSLDERLAERLAEELRDLPEPRRERVRESWRPEDGAVLETACALSAEAIGELSAAASALVGRPAELTVRQRPELLGGARLRLGGHVWDATLEGQLRPPADETEGGGAPWASAMPGP